MPGEKMIGFYDLKHDFVGNTMRMTGIYRITNLQNGKSYIGQSRDIYTRWKAHTNTILETSNESLIRMAFAKYGLREQVSKPGKYGNFYFEILELCEEANLNDLERHYIKELHPEYNIQLMEVNPIFTKSDKLRSKHYVQYHSLNKMGYFPGPGDQENDEGNNYGIITKKRMAVNMLGSSVTLILGGVPSVAYRQTRYYLWSEMVIEDVQCETENNTYLIQGIENFLNQPIDITDIQGFTEFKKKCGNFAYGLQSMDNNAFFMEVLLPLVQNNKIENMSNYEEWLKSFIEREERIHTISSEIIES